LKGAVDVDAQVARGDALWDAADAEVGISKRQVQQRAGYWYRLALPKLMGLAKAKVESRLGEISLVGAGRLKPPGPLGRWLKVDSGTKVVFSAGGKSKLTKKSGAISNGSWKMEGDDVVYFESKFSARLRFVNSNLLVGIDTMGSKWNLRRLSE